jgi:AcrR family transcriptional regulator
MDQTKDRPYHHGALRKALLSAAEAELTERGVEGFSLRSVAKRAGVSHAAPAHHFGDARGLLTALAAEGFRQFRAAQSRREAQTTQDPRAVLLAAGLGYVDFALSRPALFRLVFSSDLPDHNDAELTLAGEEAYAHLAAQVGALGGGPPEVALVWAATHGIADLIGSGRLKAIASLEGPARDAAISTALSRCLPPGPSLAGNHPASDDPAG